MRGQKYEGLEQMYVNQQLSTIQLAKKFNVSKPAIRYALRARGVQLRDSYESFLAQKPKPDVDPLTCAWMAGVLEGEGHITIAKRKTRTDHKQPFSYVIEAGVSNTEMDFIEPFHQTFKGHIGGQPSTLKGGRFVYCWKVMAYDASLFLMTVAPYIKTERKRKLCDVALQFQRARTEFHAHFHNDYSSQGYRDYLSNIERLHDEAKFLNSKQYIPKRKTVPKEIADRFSTTDYKLDCVPE